MQIVQADPAEYDPYNLCTRRIGNAIAVGVRIRGAGAAAMTVERSHRLTIDIGCRLRERFGEGAFVAVHVEPLMQRAAPFARRPPLTGFRSSFFSLRRSSQVCFRRRNLCRRPLFGADVRCARPVRRNGLAPHPFPVRMPGWEGQIRMHRRRTPDRCRRCARVGRLRNAQERFLYVSFVSFFRRPRPKRGGIGCGRRVLTVIFFTL